MSRTSDKIGRFAYRGRAVWVVAPVSAGAAASEDVTLLRKQPSTLRELIQESGGLDRTRAAFGAGETVRVDALNPLPVVTAPCDVTAVGLNYRGVLREMGRVVDGAPPMFFRKAASAIIGSQAPVRRPVGEALLDFEVELGLIVGRDLGGTQPGPAALPGLDAIAGLVVCNDVSARELQFARQQWYEGKSHRGFCPVGPWLTPLDDRLRARLSELRLRCYVNGELRQDAGLADMIHAPGELVDSLQAFADLRAGDLVLTGTPAGTAVGRAFKPPLLERVGRRFLAERFFNRAFQRRQRSSPFYLRDGDVVRVSIRTDDGEFDLGEISNPIYE